MAQAPIQMPNYMGAAQVKMAQRAQAVGEMDRIIQQYKLDAENERRVAGGALATLGAEMENNPDGVNSLAQSNPEFGKALKLLNDGKAKKKDMQIISASLAANTQARAQKLQEEQVSLLNQARKQQVDYNEAIKKIRLDNADLGNQVNRLNATILNMQRMLLESNLPAAQTEALLRKMQADAGIGLEPGRQAVEAQKQELGSKQIQGALKALDVFPLEERAELQRRAQEGQINAHEASTISLLGKAISSLDPQSIQDEAIKNLQTQMKEALSTPSIRVEVDDIRKQVTFEEWEELHKENPKKYPYNASAQQTGSRIAALSLMLQESMKSMKVLVEDDTVPKVSEVDPLGVTGPDVFGNKRTAPDTVPMWKVAETPTDGKKDYLKEAGVYWGN